MRFESLPLGCLWCSASLGLVLGRFFHHFYSCPTEPPAQCRDRVRVKRRYLKRRTVAFSSLFNFALPKPSSAQSRGTLFACNVVQGYVRACVSSFFCLLYCSTLIFRLNTSPPRGAVDAPTFHPGYLSFLRLTPRHADGPREVFRMTSLLCYYLCSPPCRRGLASS